PVIDSWLSASDSSLADLRRHRKKYSLWKKSGAELAQRRHFAQRPQSLQQHLVLHADHCQRAGMNGTGVAIQRDDLAFAERAIAKFDDTRGHVDAQFFAANQADLAQLAGDNGGV